MVTCKTRLIVASNSSPNSRTTLRVDSGFRIPDSGFRIPDSGFRALYTHVRCSLTVRHSGPVPVTHSALAERSDAPTLSAHVPTKQRSEAKRSSDARTKQRSEATLRPTLNQASGAKRHSHA